MIYHLFAQSNALGNERAQMVLSDSLQLAQRTSESWQRIWDAVINPAAPLWQAILYLGGFIFYICLILQIIKAYDKDIKSFIDILVRLGTSALFLVGNGYILIDIVKLMRAISLYWTSLVLRYTIADVKISEAIGRIQNTSAAKARTSQIFAECIDKIGTALDECVYDPVKIDRATELLNSLAGGAPLKGSILEQIVNGVTSNLTAVITNPVLSGMQQISNIIQWCVMNFYEISVIISVMFFPIFLGLALLPGGDVSLFKWFSKFTKLLLFPIAYVMIIGFVAVVIAGTEQLGLPLGATFVDIGYAVFISFFAPFLAWSGINSMATGVYESTTSAAKTSAEAGVSAVSAGASLPLKVAEIKALGG